MPEEMRQTYGSLIAVSSTSAIAWAALIAGASSTVLPVCAALVPLSASLDLTLALNSPAQLAAAWALMIVAMMAPLLVAPLRHLRDRSFARRRTRALSLFALGYFAIWMMAGAGLQVVALLARSVAPDLVFALAASTALLWQISPAKQSFLNRCHRQPELAAFGAAADRDALAYGASHGAACAGSCWALMLLPLVVTQFHLSAMIAVAVFIFAERLDGPAPAEWGWRGAGRALRIMVAQTELHLMPRRRVKVKVLS